MDTTSFERDGLVFTFNPTSRENTITVMIEGQAVSLNACEASDLHQWLHDKEGTFFSLEHHDLEQADQTADLTDEQIIQIVRRKALEYFAQDPKNKQRIEEVWIDSRAKNEVIVKAKWTSGDAEEPVDDMIFTVTSVDGELGIHGPEW